MVKLFLTLIFSLTLSPLWALIDAPILTGFAQCSNSGSTNFYTGNRLDWYFPASVVVPGGTKYLLEGRERFSDPWVAIGSYNASMGSNHTPNYINTSYYIYRVAGYDNNNVRISEYSKPMIIFKPAYVNSPLCSKPNGESRGYPINDLGMLDIGLRIRESGQTKNVCILPPDQTSKLKIQKDGITFSVALLDPSHAYALKTRIQVASQTKALCDWGIIPAGCTNSCTDECVGNDLYKRKPGAPPACACEIDLTSVINCPNGCSNGSCCSGSPTSIDNPDDKTFCENANQNCAYGKRTISYPLPTPGSCPTCSCLQQPSTCSIPAPANANMCDGDNTDLLSNTTSTLVAACTPDTKCEYTCAVGFQKCGNSCIPVEQCCSQEANVAITTRPTDEIDDNITSCQADISATGECCFYSDAVQMNSCTPQMAGDVYTRLNTCCSNKNKKLITSSVSNNNNLGLSSMSYECADCGGNISYKIENPPNSVPIVKTTATGTCSGIIGSADDFEVPRAEAEHHLENCLASKNLSGAVIWDSIISTTGKYYCSTKGSCINSSLPNNAVKCSDIKDSNGNFIDIKDNQNVVGSPNYTLNDSCDLNKKCEAVCDTKNNFYKGPNNTCVNSGCINLLPGTTRCVLLNDPTDESDVLDGVGNPTTKNFEYVSTCTATKCEAKCPNNKPLLDNAGNCQECLDDTDCNDNKSCTTDKCSSGTCIYSENTACSNGPDPDPNNPGPCNNICDTLGDQCVANGCYCNGCDFICPSNPNCQNLFTCSGPNVTCTTNEYGVTTTGTVCLTIQWGPGTPNCSSSACCPQSGYSQVCRENVKCGSNVEFGIKSACAHNWDVDPPFYSCNWSSDGSIGPAPTCR